MRKKRGKEKNEKQVKKTRENIDNKRKISSHKNKIK